MSRSVKDELRANAIKKIRAGEPLFPRVLGYEETVLPKLENALLAGHDIVFLGERGQAKTRLIRSMVDILDEWMPIISGSEINDDPYHPVSKYAKDLVAEHGEDTRIDWVHREAEATYARVAAELKALTTSAIDAIKGDGDDELTFDVLGGDAPKPFVAPENGVLDNGRLRVTIDPDGIVMSVFDLEEDREVLPPHGFAGLPQLHRDNPNQWDAWDIDPFYRNWKADLIPSERVDDEDGVVVRAKFGNSVLTPTIRLREGAKQVDFSTEVDWQEREKLLKIAFPLDLRAEVSTAETQFGHLHRPVHTNTSWEAAKF